MKILILFLAINLSACSLFRKAPTGGIAEKPPSEAEVIRSKVRQEFSVALNLLDSGRYNEAGRYFKRILQQYPSSDMELLIIYNLGGALEGLGKCDLAAARYREVINKSVGQFPKVESQAMLRLSYAYECLGDDSKVIASLFDLQKRASSLSAEVSEAEVPARLAAAYSRLGNKYLAQTYYNRAQEGLKKINALYRNPQKKQELLSKTLFFMGNMDKHVLSSMKPEAYIQSLTYLQNYLLMSIEMDHSEWSLKSANELIEAYNKVFEYLKNKKVDSKDPVIVKQLKTEKINVIESTLQSIESIKAQRFAEASETRMLKSVFSKISEKEKQLNLQLAELARGNELTPEAVSRARIKVPMQEYSEPSILEKQKAKK